MFIFIFVVAGCGSPVSVVVAVNAACSVVTTVVVCSVVSAAVIITTVDISGIVVLSGET